MTSPAAVSARRQATPPARLPGVALLVAVLVAMPLAAAVGQAAAPAVVSDPGPVVRWGVLYARVVHDVAASATIGLLLFAAFIVPETTRTHRRATAIRLAGLAAVVWALAAAAGVVLGMADFIGIPLSDPAFGQQLATFVWKFVAFRVQVITAAVAAVIAVVTLLTAGRTVTAWLAVLGVAGVLPLALAGHAAGASDHSTAVNALAVHLVAVTVWVGGVLALAALRPLLSGPDLSATAHRFSTLAGWCYAAVALSGVQSAVLRVGDWSNLATRYGALVLVKTAALVLLGAAGWWHRRSLLARLSGSTPGLAFTRLLVAELAVMGAAVGTAVAMARSAPPVSDAPLPDASPAFVLTGYPTPPPLTSSSWLTTWTTEWLWVGLAALAVGLYVAGVVRLRRRGDAWPVHRVVVWVLGWAIFVYAVCGAPGVYGRVLFSMHMAMHMVVAMLVPLLLVPAAPVLLALRTLPARPDRTWGPREVILQVVHSRVFRAFANPVVAAALFFFSLAIFYYSPLFELALRTHTGHVLMLLHFLGTGYLFVWVLIGIDPGPRKWPPLMLLVILFATMSFHAFFGVVMTGSTTVLAPDFFEVVKIPWMTDVLGDQRKAGAIAWGIGEAPTVLLTLMVAVAWVRTDRAETTRKDRQADRDGDAELAAYNAHLQELRRRSEGRS
ncbi:bifunctional copper resistance protein CopD/cytochrome c oxidase assembly protein [Phycicoccus sp. Soil748]|uniref:bifunctional copper resistance protein CopD/cytochrome c oxidase assembly protein n=1 Tax=Phycicoccus sp. Soil748 TaxID=1736397 RepID=UPI000702AD4C|nr:bifunctional copper resistance protein CopD/cytochrome c oxidase assembly protein [Phycicoccus sp. Soil748]KRE56213.1 cytochrome C oxidase assembly protein [Phycicoccus sp. Soil748]